MNKTIINNKKEDLNRTKSDQKRGYMRGYPSPLLSTQPAPSLSVSPPTPAIGNCPAQQSGNTPAKHLDQCYKCP